MTIASGPPGISAIISSRICHDLVSPIGAIVNGVDLIREIGGGNVDDELGMISQSAERASSILQFYRVAFGAAEADAAAIARSTLHDQATRLIATQRIVLDWPGLQGAPLQRAEARLLYQMLLCAKSIVAMRGVIRVHLGVNETLPLTIRIDGSDGAPVNADLVRNFKVDPETEHVPPGLIEFPLAWQSARALGLDLRSEQQGGTLLLIAED